MKKNNAKLSMMLFITFLTVTILFGSFTFSVAQGQDSQQQNGQQQPGEGPQFYQFENNMQFNLSATATVGYRFQYEETVTNRFIGVEILNTDEVNISIRVSDSFQKGPKEYFYNKYLQGNKPSSAGSSEFLSTDDPISSILPSPEEVNIEDYEIGTSYNTFFTIDIESGLDNLQSISFHTYLDTELGLTKTDDQLLYWTVYDNQTETWSLVSTIAEEDELTTSISAETLASGQVILSLVNLTPISTSFFSSTLGITIMIGSVVLLAVGLMMSTEEYRSYLLNRFLPLNKGPHRLSMEQVLENETRGRIIETILETPGIHFNEILRRVSISAGTLAWHLDILETFKIIKKERVGQYLVYFSYLDANPLENMDFKLQKSQSTLEILRLIRENPGIYQNLLAKKLKLNHKTVKYHISKLLDINLIYFKQEGRKRLFYGS